PFQKHVSGIYIKELKEMGFNVHIVNGRPSPKTIRLFIKIRAYILRRKVNKSLIGWKDKL
ncbi:unnamed protein product, partial [marine sediment metagenome]